MARFEFRLPDIGEGIAEAEIVGWHVKVGDRVSEDQGVADMMTDKATVEMESPVSGIVAELAGDVGDMVPIGSTLLVIETDGDVEAPPSAPSAEPAGEPSRVAEKVPEPEREPGTDQSPPLHFIPSRILKPLKSTFLCPLPRLSPLRPSVHGQSSLASISAR